MFIMYLAYPTWFIGNMLVASTITAFMLCKLYNKDFFNPQLYCGKYITDKTYYALTLATQYIINYNVLYYTIVQHKLHEPHIDIHYRVLQNFKFILVLEFIGYWIHRLSHSIQYIYKNSHSHHHVNLNIYPVDFLQVDYVDNAIHSLYMSLPLCFVSMGKMDYNMIYYIYTTCGFLIHSDIITRHHIIHHKMFKYNFCVLVPVFDVLFGTYKT